MTYNPISVSQLNKYIKDKFEEDEYFANVLVEGEISNFKNHYTGHMYFTLKDDKSLIKAIMFKTYTGHLDFVPQDGMKVMILGSVSVFERDGTYQLYAKAMKQLGKMGDLRAAYEELKEKLEKEGLFDQSHKKPIPMMPKTIGVLTSNTGAVIRDIINVSTRRNPNVHIRLFPVPVQGEGAGKKIAEGIEFMNKNKLADVLIVARGGGSLEDLWPFNEEIVARAIYNSKIPVISAVGHEIDYTIADFVADLRAPTPTAAAELAVPDITTILSYLDTAKVRSSNAISNLCDSKRMLLNKLEDSYILKRPMAIYEAKEQKLDNLIDNLRNAINKKIEIKKVKLFELTNSYVFYNPDIVLGVKRNNLENVIHKLEILNPLNTLKRGYTITRFNDKIITNASIVKKDDIITVEFVDGVVKSKILEVDK